MSHFKQSDFEFLEDEFLNAECDACNHTIEDESEFDECDGVCPECGGELLIYTCNEGQDCRICNSEFQPWENCYIHKEDSDIKICESCYNELEED